MVRQRVDENRERKTMMFSRAFKDMFDDGELVIAPLRLKRERCVDITPYRCLSDDPETGAMLQQHHVTSCCWSIHTSRRHQIYHVTDATYVTRYEITLIRYHDGRRRAPTTCQPGAGAKP